MCYFCFYNLNWERATISHQQRVIPGLGEPADALNGIWYTIEGDATNATLSFAATVPVIGWVSTGGKWVLKARRIGKISKEGGKFVLKYGDDIAKLTDKVSDLGFTDEMVAALEKDLKDPSFFEALIKNNDLIASWKKMDNLGADEALRRNPGALEALATPHGSRPDPNDYLSQSYINSHLSKFENDDIVRVTRQSNIDGYGGTLGGSDAFVLPKSEFSEIYVEVGGDIREIEK